MSPSFFSGGVLPRYGMGLITSRHCAALFAVSSVLITLSFVKTLRFRHLMFRQFLALSPFPNLKREGNSARAVLAAGTSVSATNVRPIVQH